MPQKREGNVKRKLVNLHFLIESRVRDFFEKEAEKNGFTLSFYLRKTLREIYQQRKEMQ